VGKWKNEKDKWLIKETTEIFWFRVGEKIIRVNIDGKCYSAGSNPPFIQL
jgi:hypothetical protein